MIRIESNGKEVFVIVVKLSLMNRNKPILKFTEICLVVKCQPLMYVV